MLERLKKWFDKSGYVLLFVISFIFFLYLTFPYGVLKETMAAVISKQIGLDIHIGELRPNLPLGFDLTDVSVVPSGGGPRIELKEAQINLSVLNFLFGSLAVSLDLEDKDRGELSTSIKFSLIDVIKKNYVPYKVSLDASKFGVGQFIVFGLNRLVNRPGNAAGQMFTSLVDQMKIMGKLQGEATFALDVSNLSDSSGNVNLKLNNASLKLDNPSLEMSDQTFTKAQFQASMSGGSLNIAKDSGFQSQELQLGFSGDARLKPQFGQSQLNFNINLRLDKSLKDNFGVLVDAQGGTDGAIKISIKGTMDRPAVTST